MEDLRWTDRVTNEVVLHRVKEKRNTLYALKRKKANRIRHISGRNCILKHVIEEKIETKMDGSGRRGRRPKQLLDDLFEKSRHWNMKQEALHRALWRTSFGRGYG